MWKTMKNDPWLKLTLVSTIALVVLSFIQFILSRFNASTMELMMKMMRGMFLSMFLRDVLNVAIQVTIMLLLIGAGIGMFLHFKRKLQN